MKKTILRANTWFGRFRWAAFVVLAGLILPTAAIALSAGPNSPSSASNNTSIGSRSWSSTSNVYTSNNQNASATSLTSSSSGISNYLVATGFGFSIPANSTINGIQVSIERRDGGVSSSRYIRDNSIKIVKGGSVTGTDHANTSANWPNSDAYANYGSTTDLWGTTWTAADINASSFGVAISARGSSSSSETAYIDHIRITVTYTTAAACTAHAPTVTVTPASQTISTNAGSVAYSVTVMNNDTGTGCSAVSFNLAAADSNTTAFNASALGASSVSVAPSATSSAITLTVSAKSGQTSGSNTTTVTASSTGHTNGSSSASTTLNVSAPPPPPSGGSAGPNSPSSASNNTTIGSRSWSSTSNVYTSNNQNASATNLTSSTASNYLVATGFGFSIPAGSTITGIAVAIERRDGGVSSSRYIRDNSIKIVKGGSITGTDYANTSANWPNSDAYANYGSTTDLWGTTWTAADINASTFGVAVSARGSSSSSETAYIDHIRITVYYTAGVACTAAAPTVSITSTPKTITSSGGSAGYTKITVANNDTGSGCTDVTFNLSASDSNTTNFNASTLTPQSVTLAPGETSVLGDIVLTVNSKPGQLSGTNTTTLSATSAGHAPGSASITTTLNVVCTLSAPTLGLTPGTQLISANGGSASYTLNVQNNDTPYACSNTSFALSVADTNSGSFSPSTLSQNSVSLAPGANANVILTVKANTGFTTGSNDTTVSATASGHASASSNTVTTSIDIPGVCSANTPILAIDPAGSTPPGGTATYLVTLTNTDSSACSDSTFTFSVLSDSNPGAFVTPSTLNPTSLSLMPGQTDSVVLSVTARPTAAQGALNTTVVRATAPGHTSSANVSVSTTVSTAFPPTTAKLVHNSVTTGSTYWNTQGGWGVTGGKYGQFTCTTCHVSEAPNIKRIKGLITVPDTSKGNIPGSTVDFQATTTLGGFGDDTKFHASSNKICEVCHTQTSVHKYNQPTVVSHESSVGIYDCVACHKHSQGFKPAGGCTICHNMPLGNRVAVTGQFSANSHHVQRNGAPVSDQDCYQCHWEANSDGSMNATYHGGSASSGSPVNLVIYGAGTRPSSYAEGTTGISYTANGSRTELAKINSHCLGCHDDDTATAQPFGDGKTPSKYAWDGTSVKARYSQIGTTLWGKYSGPNVTPKNTQTKAYSAHGNAAANQRGWNLSETWPNTSGSVQVLCFDCHNSHGSSASGKSSSYTSATPSGGILKDTTAGKGGYAMTYKPVAGGSTANKNLHTAAAALCFDCHLTQNAGTKPWGYQGTYGSTQALLGYLDTPYFAPGALAGPQQRFAYKATVAQKGGHFGASSGMGTVPMGTIGGLCTPCHDPHGVSPTLGANQAYGVPLLKGTWMTSPYKEDVAPLATNVKVGVVGESRNQTAYNGASVPGYRIDQNTFEPDTLTMPKGSGSVSPMVTWPFNSQKRITETPEQFAGLCLKCHPKSSISPTTGGAWKSMDRVHNTVKGWGGSGANANNAVHSYTCSKCHAPHNSALNRLIITNCLDYKHRGRVASGGVAGQFSYSQGSPSSSESGRGNGRFPAGGGGMGNDNADKYAYFFGSTAGTRACHDNTNATGWPNNQYWNVKSPW